MNRPLASEWRARKLAAAIGNHFVPVHVELRSAACHPHMQGKHFLVLAGKNFVADLNDEPMGCFFKSPASEVGVGSGFFQDSVCADHLSWDKVFADTEMFKRALRLGAP